MSLHQPKIARAPTQAARANRPTPSFMPDVSGNADLSGLEQLQMHAVDSPMVQRLSVLQRAANEQTAADRPVRGRDIHMGTAPAQHAAQVAQSQTRSTMQAKGTVPHEPTPVLEGIGALATPMSGDPSQRQILRGSSGHTALQTSVHGGMTAPETQVPTAPFTTTAQLDAMGVQATAMSTSAYADWTQTVQCKMGVHGHARAGNHVIVTQRKGNSDTAQMVDWAKVKRKAKDAIPALLIIAEGILGMVAAGLAGAGTGGVALVPAVLLGVGSGIKFFRGIVLLWYGKDNENYKKFSPYIVALEAALAAAAAITSGVGIAKGLITGDDTRKAIGLGLFAIAKAFRAAMTWLAERQAKKPGGGSESWIKGYKAAAALAHVVEVAALGWIAGETGALGNAAGAAIGATVGTAKLGRAGKQGYDAYTYQKSPDGNQANAAGNADGENEIVEADFANDLEGQPTLDHAAE